MSREFFGSLTLVVSLLSLGLTGQIQFKESSLPKSHFLFEEFDQLVGAHSISRKKQNINLDFSSTNNYIQFESSQKLGQGKLIDLFIVKTKKYTHDLNIFNNYHNHLLFLFFEDRIEIRSRNLNIVSAVEDFGETMAKLKKSKQNFKMTKEQQDSLKLSFIQCEQFQKNTLNCVGIFEPQSIVLHLKFRIRVTIQNSNNESVFHELVIVKNLKFLAPIQRLLKSALMINGHKNKRKWDRKKLDFKPKSISLFSGPPKDQANIIIVIRSQNGHFL